MTVPAAVVANFTQFRLETHVEKALRAAWAFSIGKPIDASHLLKGALVVAQSDPSDAFAKLRALLPLTMPPGLSATSGLPADLAALPLVKPLADSFSVAEGFLKDSKKTVWGRDYVTLALLAKDDPSLDVIARQAGTNVESLRQAWLDFVRSTDRRRTAESWRQWWRGAGVPLADERKADEQKPTENAYIFTWNPSRFHFPEMEAHANKVKAGGVVAFGWSTGNRRDISLGARVYLLRQGPEPRGLVGVGTVNSEVAEEDHWDEEERKKGKKSSIVDVAWTALSRDPFLDLTGLVEETGDASVWSTQVGGVRLEPSVHERLDKAWPRAWARHRHGLPDDRLPDIPPRHWIAPFDADTGKRDDSLEVERYVDAFARVMASRTLSPPLSIGLFGDWGSGKTFFMDRLHDRIRTLAEAPDGKTPLYWHRICQMRFNAWHYTETNLWASLVSTMFNELCVFLDGRTDDADQFTRLLNQLEVAQALRKEAQENLTEAQRQHGEAVQKVKDAQKQLVELPRPAPLSDKELRRILEQEVAAVVGTDAAEIASLLESAADWSGREEFRTAAQRLSEGKTTVEASRALIDEAGALSAKAGFWWRLLLEAKVHKSRGFWFVVALLVAIPVIFTLASRFGLQQGWAHLWTLLGEALTVLAAGVAWARGRLSGASAVFDRLGSLRANIESKIEEARNKDRLLFEAARETALTKEAEAKARLEGARREEERTAEVERKAEEEVRNSTSQARLGRFIRERTSSADYEKHLGLIAMIHRDFNKLSDLMGHVRDQELGKVPDQPIDPTLPRIDRIILYIDDLDRCHPPSRVVRVLEAVHLLLFFPLFVVVVGVDSRWVSRSLYRHYKGMLADEAMDPVVPTGDPGRAPAESQDFLEKIFQVPFWLRRMDPQGIRRLIHSLITGAEVEAAAPIAPPAEGGAPAPNATASAGGGGNATGTEAEDPARAAAKRVTREAEMVADDVDEPLAIPSESLKITQKELDFMDQVAALMPRTPRSVKRFVNIYRLYKAALSPQAFARFLGTPDRPGNFRAVQVLLALVTGTPRFAQTVFSRLHAPDDDPATTRRLSHLVDDLDDGQESSATTRQALREFAREKNDLELTELREVSSLVGRYSVHHMVSQSPGEAGLG